MELIKKLFQDNSIVGLCGIKKQKTYIKINIPEYIKKTRLTDYNQNYLLSDI